MEKDLELANKILAKTVKEGIAELTLHRTGNLGIMTLKIETIKGVISTIDIQAN